MLTQWTRSEDVRASTVDTSWCLRAVAEDGSETRRLPLCRFPFRVGRKPGLDLSLATAAVSKEHAELFLIGSELLIRDLNSINGTYVNGERIATPTPLSTGDRVVFATQQFQLQVQSENLAGATQLISSGELVQVLCQFERVFDAGQATPFYQPIVRFDDLSVYGHEVLGRSQVSGLTGAGELFAAAARFKLEGELSRLFRLLGVQQADRLPECGHLFLNTHPEELADVRLIQSLAELRNLAPQLSLVLEIHEKAITDPTQMHALRQALSELDIGLAYDDFGAGQDRLLALAEVPPDMVKFDARLIRDLHTASAARQQTVATLVKLAQDLGSATLAEAVETEDEAQVCKQLGFDFAQGYLYGRPAPAGK